MSDSVRPAPEDVVTDVIDYLSRQVDPLDRANPKYAEINRQIDALIAARVDIESLRTPLLRIHADGRVEVVRE